MGRPRTVNRALPKYASAFTDNRGKRRVRLRRTGYPTLYVEAPLDSPEFTVEYNRWLENGKAVVGKDRHAPGTFDDLISRFYQSKDWTALKKTTQVTYRGELERFRATYGERHATTIQARHIATLLGKMSATPSAANNLKKRLGQLFDFAIVLGWRTDNPARPVKALRTPKGGFQTWQEEQIAAFEANYAVGTQARLLFDLALYTAQRRSDLTVMGPQHVEAGRIRVRQLKTDKTLLIPLHPALARSIAATPTGHLAFITSNRGAPYTKESLGNWFRDRCDEADLQGFSLHGLRKAASRRMAEIGLSNQLIKAITGHVTDSEVSRYTRDAEQQRMADLAMESLASKFG
jgi:integrase